MTTPRTAALATLTASCLVLGVAPLATAQAPAPRVVPAAVQPVANPQISNSCGLDATLVLDASGSVRSAGAIEKVRAAGEAFLRALKDTKSTARLTQFGSLAEQLAPRATVDTATLAGPFATGLGRYYHPIPPVPAGVTVWNGSRSFPGPSSNINAIQFTNWQQSLNEAATEATTPEIIVYVTDGDPTAYDLDRPSDNHYKPGPPYNVTVNASSTGQALDRAITAANLAKSRNSRMLVVGVGPAVSRPGSASVTRMTDIAGPQVVQDLSTVSSINQIDVALVSRFDDLADFLRRVVSELCTPSMTIRKLAQTPGSTQYTPASGWNVAVTPTVAGGFDWILPSTTPEPTKDEDTDAQGYAQFQWEPRVSTATSSARVVETAQAGYTPGRPGTDNDYVCDVRTPDTGEVVVERGDFDLTDPARPAFTFSVGPRNIVTCDIANSFDYAPQIHLVKTAADNPVRGNAAGWDEVYTFTVTNPGNTPLEGVAVTDPKCVAAPVGPASGGDANGDGSLDPGETWEYTCTSHISHPTVTTAISASNTATVTGVDPRGTLVTDEDTISVGVRTPAIAIAKAARDAQGNLIPDGQVEPAGSRVTYEYSVTNAGNDPLRTVVVTDDRCAPVTYVRGDTNGDHVLQTSETWVYQCATLLRPPSTESSVTNTATATALWSNPQDRSQNNAPVTSQATKTIPVDLSADLHIVKAINPGGTDQDFGFTVASPGGGVPAADEAFTLNPGNPSSATPASRDIVVRPDPGNGSTYTITETFAQGWDLTALTCRRTRPDGSATTIPGDPGTGVVAVPMESGDSVTCTFTNQRRPSLRILKRTSPTGDTTMFDFTTSRPIPLAPLSPATFALTDGASRTFANLAPGEVSIQETVPAGWRLDDADCDTPTQALPDGVSLALHYGDQVTCTWNNAQLAPATLTVVKSGTPDVTSPDFPFRVSGDGLLAPGDTGEQVSFSMAVGGSRQFTVHPPLAGSDYQVNESAPDAPPPGQSSWALTRIRCVVNGSVIPGDVGDRVVMATLKPGDTATCTFTNEVLPRLRIRKSVVVGTGQTGADTSFDFTPTGLVPAAGFALSNASPLATFTDVAVGAPISVVEDEANVAPWTLTELVCSGPGHERITADRTTGTVSSTGLLHGDDVVCGYVNTKNPPAAGVLFITKATDPAGSPAQFDFTASGLGLTTPSQPGSEDFTLGDGEVQAFQVSPEELGTQYTVTEDAATGWARHAISCRVSSDPSTVIPGDLATGVVAVTIKPAEIAVCSYVNQQLASLTIRKVTDVATSRGFPFTATGVTPTSFVLGSGQSRRFSGLAAGTSVSVTELVPNADTDVPDRWELADLTCTGAATDPVINLATATVELTLAAGEDVQCTFDDAAVQPATITVIKDADPADGELFVFHADGEHGGVLPPDRDFGLIPDGGSDARTFEVYPPAAGEEYLIQERLDPSTQARWGLLDLQCYSAGLPVGNPGPPGGVLVALLPGQTATCRFFNQMDASLTAAKSAPDDPSLDFPFAWSTAGSPFTLRDGQANTAGNLDPGSYWVQESIDQLPSDWYLAGDPTCTGTAATPDYSTPGRAALEIAAGEDAHCLFANFYDYRPAMQLAKSASPTTVISGLGSTYSYVLTNTGNVPLGLAQGSDKDDVVTDNLCSPVTYLSGDTGSDDVLSPQEAWTFTCASAGLTQDTLNTGTATMVDRTSTPNAPQTLTATDTALVRVLVPAIEVTKVVDQPLVYPGTEVEYGYQVTNTGQVDLREVSLVDDRCPTVSGPSGDGTSPGILSVGEIWTYTCTATIDVDTDNTATVTGTPTFLPPGGQVQTGTPVQDQATESVQVIVRDITLAKVPSAPSGQLVDGVLRVPVGTTVTYTYSVTSGTATVPMDILTLTDDQCSPVTYASGDTDADGLVDPGETWIFTCDRAFPGSEDLTNTAVVTAVEPQLGGTAQDTASARVISYESAISLTKSPSAGIVPPGTPVTYTYEVANPGQTVLTDIVLVDDRCSPVTYVSGDTDSDTRLDLTETWVYTCTTPIEVATLNTATVTGRDPFQQPVTDTSQAIVLVPGVAGLTAAIAITKSPSATVITAGGAVTYTYQVSNAGDLALANVAANITDDRCAPVTYVSGDEDGNGLLTSGREPDEAGPAEVWTFTCTTTLPVTTTNTVTVSGTPVVGGVVMGPNVSAGARATVRVITPPTPTPTPTQTGGPVDPGGCGSDGGGSDCAGIGPQVPLKVRARKASTSVPARKRTTVVYSATTSKKATLTQAVTCRDSQGRRITGCTVSVGSHHSIRLRVTGCAVRSASVSVRAVPKPAYRTSYRSTFWVRTWKVRRC